MTFLITQSNPDVKRAAVAPKAGNINIKGPYYPSGAYPGDAELQKELGGITLDIDAGTGRTKIVKVTLNPGDLLNRLSNVLIISTDNTLLSVTGYPGVNPAKKYGKVASKESPAKLYIYSAFPFGSGSKKITKKTTFTFTFKNAAPFFQASLVGPKPTNTGGFLWYGSDKTVIYGPSNRNQTSLTIPRTTKMISSQAFYGCTNLTGDLFIPKSVTYIGSYAFNGCTKLAGSLTIQNNNIKLGDYVFNGNGGLTGAITLYRSNIKENSLVGTDRVDVTILD
jgi:hypothetical protein